MISDPLERSATALYELAYNHPFVEGNKRTALILCENLLEGDLHISAKESDIYDYVMQVARGERTIDEIIIWLKANTSSSE